jgi:gliding motility-associated-like protein
MERMKRLLSSLIVIAALSNGVLPAAEDTELEFNEDGFIPAEVFFRNTDRASVTISPNGKHLAGTRWDNWVKYRYRLVTFTYDLDSREITVIHRGMDGTWARWYNFTSDDDLLVRFYHGALYRISPNGDNLNDLFRIQTDISEAVILSIFDRWGNKVFETDEISTGWDGRFQGRNLGNDVFGYILKVVCIGGEQYIKRGSITLVR